MRQLQVAWLLAAAGLTHGAINLAGEQASLPATTVQDDSPISDINAYHPEYHDCPLYCNDMSNTNAWIPYISVNRLGRCEEPMLLDVATSQRIQNDQDNVLIRTCTLTNNPKRRDTAASQSASNVVSVKNPKKVNSKSSALNTAPACFADGTHVSSLPKLLKSPSGSQKPTDAIGLLKGIQQYFANKDNCNEKIIFARHNGTVAGVYIGAGLGKPTVKYTLDSLANRLQSDGSMTNRTTVEICGGDRQRERTFGVAIDTSDSLSAVHTMVMGWSRGECAQDRFLHAAGSLSGAKVYDITPHMGNSTHSNTSSAHATGTESNPDKRLRSLTKLMQRATCRYLKVEAGDDGCPAMATKCKISPADFTKYNSAPGFCSGLRAGDYVCCSTGDRYKPPAPDKPKPEADGTCNTHLIKPGDTCDDLARSNGLTVSEIEGFNKGKTWGWTNCKDMLGGYNLCLSKGKAPLPPPQAGTLCGPLVPGTKGPSDESVSLADLNPCPLKACCSNWGFCGPFPAHCDIHSVPGGGPGTKDKNFPSSCISNCGTEIKQNSGPPAEFQRIGYWEEFGMDRECLTLPVKDANTDGSYTHIHWAFADIDPKTFEIVVKDKHKQFDAFKAMSRVKRIVSLGGWAFSTEAATYNIIRQAILNNRDKFVNNIYDFITKHNLDGIDIDWEYPGAPDIFADGHPIGEKGDGIGYLKFLMSLKKKMGSKSVSIAAPASYWYLQAFPIDRIAKVIDYIVYMTYDLHGQWDYGNVNAFDSCPSGKCIRSHVNLTETRSSLSIITKAGVANNKIFVGESSYGRSFRMAKDGCWGPMCEFTGSRTKSDAHPGRCTGTSGYIGYAEINELLRRGDVRSFHDGNSNTDILLYGGDYVSYMTPTTKDTRREDWKKLNFAGSIDWAVDLQTFGNEDIAGGATRGPDGFGCVHGLDLDKNTAKICEFTCNYGFCPDELCICYEMGQMKALPPAKGIQRNSYDPFDTTLNQLCRFACNYGYCPDEICDNIVIDAEPSDEDDSLKNCTYVVDGKCQDADAIRNENSKQCNVYLSLNHPNDHKCERICREEIQAAKDSGAKTWNSGCTATYGLEEKPQTFHDDKGNEYIAGRCDCNNELVNEFAEEMIDFIEYIAAIGCFILMKALETVVRIGLDAFPVGRAISAGLDGVASAIQSYGYVYGDEGAKAFDWWLSPCPRQDLVPDDIKKAFDIIQSAEGRIGSWKPPKNIGKNSGKKGDDMYGNKGLPKGRNPGPKRRPGKKPGGNTRKKCTIKPKDELRRVYGNTIQTVSCDKQGKTQKTQYAITKGIYAKNAARTTSIQTCVSEWGQACYHYRSVIKNNKKWNTLECFDDAATVLDSKGKFGPKQSRKKGFATETWSNQRDVKINGKDSGWLASSFEVTTTTTTKSKDPPKTTTYTYDRLSGYCDRDEFPPSQFMQANDPDFVQGGTRPDAQLVRFLPAPQNRGAGSGLWGGSLCIVNAIEHLDDKKLLAFCVAAMKKDKAHKAIGAGVTQYRLTATLEKKPVLTIGSWDVPPAMDDGLADNTFCWPSKKAPNDPGFALLDVDPWFNGKSRPCDYRKKYDPAAGNGV